jgi:hypothetical protein
MEALKLISCLPGFQMCQLCFRTNFLVFVIEGFAVSMVGEEEVNLVGEMTLFFS